jgi:hypothetical protein
MSVIADELHITIVLVVVRHYLSYRISTCSARVAGGVPVRMYTLSVLRMAVTPVLGSKPTDCITDGELSSTVVWIDLHQSFPSIYSGMLLSESRNQPPWQSAPSITSANRGHRTCPNRSP